MLSANLATLRPFAQRDIELLMRMRNDLRVEAASQSTEPAPVTEAVFRARFASGMAAVSSGGAGDVEFVITRTGDVEGNGLGVGGLYGLDRFNRHAELGVTIASEADRRGGIGIDSYIALARYAFLDLGLNKVYGNVKGTNEAARGTMLRLGLRAEGVRREHRWERGDFVDLHHFSLLRRDWTEELVHWRERREPGRDSAIQVRRLRP